MIPVLRGLYSRKSVFHIYDICLTTSENSSLVIRIRPNWWVSLSEIHFFERSPSSILVSELSHTSFIDIDSWEGKKYQWCRYFRIRPSEFPLTKLDGSLQVYFLPKIDFRLKAERGMECHLATLRAGAIVVLAWSFARLLVFLSLPWNSALS